ncbi:MAG: hypothetical protein B5M54_05875 [Candidatus Aminicenantes bacterium 4484_214]|nr:MAG: hypothetical protein B5M54_05875 [Candidatus Aminicenantes bacterium 4484_214]RLE09932.1 MAG: hypothetical protein DRJ06_01935 [Candidatus Aminicenantes bacterium]
MKKCKYEELIDDYLLGRLSPPEKEAFEEHYFNCSLCFHKLQERDAIISVIKSEGVTLFQDIYARELTKSPSWWEKLTAFLPFPQVAVAVTTAAIVLLVVLGINSLRQPSSPQFILTDSQVRGESITLISPVIDINSIPTEFRWTSLGNKIKYYRIYIYNHELLWSHQTEENFVILPEEVKEKLKAGEKYSWQVKAFAGDGHLVAVSSRVQFKVTPRQ